MRSWRLPVLLTLAAGAVTFHFISEHRHAEALAQVRADVAALAEHRKDLDSRPVSGRGDTAFAPPFSESDSRPPARSKLPARGSDTDAHDPTGAASNSEESAGTEAPPRKPKTAAELREHYQQAFAAESADPAWAREAERTAESKIASALPASSSLRSVDCRASMCRIETVHGSAEDFQVFAQTALMNPSTQIGSGASFSTVLGDAPQGGRVIVTYLSRDGESLPPPDDAL